MIDDIVEMILKEAEERGISDIFDSLFSVLTDINDAAIKIILEHMIRERSKPHDR